MHMLRLLLTGSPDEVHPFVHDLKAQPQYQIKLETPEILEPELIRIRASVRFFPTDRSPITVKLLTPNQKEIDIHFLDGLAVRLDDRILYVSGKVFDIFG
jgi:hypothetical protein